MAKFHNLTSRCILRVALTVPLYRLFDYLPPADLEDDGLWRPGQRLEVPFGKSKKIGFLIETALASEIAPDRLKPALKLLDVEPLLSEQDIRLLKWASDYYHHPLGEVFSAAFPVLLRSAGKTKARREKHYTLTESGKTLPLAQLQRSARQREVLSFLQQNSGASAAQLKQLGPNLQTVVRALAEKHLIQESEAISLEVNPEQAWPEQAPSDKGLPLNAEQQQAVQIMQAGLGGFGVYLLDGVTGSGKTEIYMHIIGKVLTQGRQVLVLVPEINLTPQLEDRFRQRFSMPIAVSHSSLTDRQRYGSWLAMQQGDGAIMLGTRSALFAPLKKPGLIILDEEHDASFKQQDGFRFSARDTAIMRAKMLDIPVLLGSATPSLESLYNANQQRYRHLILTQRAGGAFEPEIQLLDIRNKKMRHGLSETLVEALEAVLKRGEQALLFLNRRGFAPVLTCHGCGWVARCLHCDANLVIHNKEKQLRCHHCGWQQVLAHDCPACKGKQLVPLGLGTERIEEGLGELFPGKILVRIDRDSTQRKGALEGYLEQINSGAADIILGTQMLAKGHHFPNVTLAAILDVDSGLFSIDFHTAEKLAQTIVQVAGRSGRSEKPGKVILQTRHPDHPLLNVLIKDGYGRFAQMALAERRNAGLPPYSYHALLRAQAVKSGLAQAFLKAAAASPAENVQILGPVSAPMEKRAGLYRYQLLFQSRKRSDLQFCLTQLVAEIGSLPHAKQIRWSLDVDPVDLY